MLYMKCRKFSKVLKYSVSGRFSLSEKADPMCNLTIQTPVTTVCKLGIAIREDHELLNCPEKQLPAAVPAQGQRGTTSSRTRVVKTQHCL